MAFQAPATGNHKITFSVGRESTHINLDTVYLFKGNPNVFRRNFENGIVVINATSVSKNVDLGGTFQRINGFQDSTVNNGQKLSSLTLDPWDAAILVRSIGTTTTSPTPSVDVCGAPSYSSNSEKGLFMWKDCTAGSWRIRVSAGGDSGGVDYVGSISSDAGFTVTNPVSLEAHDSLTSDSSNIDYLMRVWNGGIDGINFAVPAASNACFTLDWPTSTKVYLGPNKVEMSSSFDLSTLDSCN